VIGWSNCLRDVSRTVPSQNLFLKPWIHLDIFVRLLGGEIGPAQGLYLYVTVQHASRTDS